MSRAQKVIEYKKARKNPGGSAKRLYSVPEAAFYLGRTVDALREIIWAGKLPYVKDGRRVLVDVKDMDEFIERNKMRFTY
ncbi:MAG: helix-turn-helix domain-containing protein [Syntrophorhabdales bacterium]|jgi:excisionase family DNA binding protein